MNCRKYEGNGLSGREVLATALSWRLAGGRARSPRRPESPSTPPPGAVLPVCFYVPLQISQKNVSYREPQ